MLNYLIESLLGIGGISRDCRLWKIFYSFYNYCYIIKILVVLEVLLVCSVFFCNFGLVYSFIVNDFIFGD